MYSIFHELWRIFSAGPEKPIKEPPKKPGKLTCTVCGGTDWYGGPEGGISINITCAKCGSLFCYSPNLMFDLIREGPEQ